MGLTSRGFNVSWASSYRGADDFTVPAGGWNITTITFFPYMGTSPTSPSPITAVYLQIWNGQPGVGSVVWGDLTTNRLASTAFANIYRRLESQPTDATRPVMSAVTTVNTTLAAGTYWLDWSVDGNASYSGPWQPPVTIDGQTTTGNAQQYTGSWVAAVDTGLGTALGFPFIIEGTVVPVELTTFTVD